MRDASIRQLLRNTELLQYKNDGSSKIVEEMNIPAAKARIDMAVINGYLHGFEIKSACDTLQRLPNQIEAYTKVFDFLSIVTEDKYHERILEITPSWIGVLICIEKTNEIKQIRAASLNAQKNCFHIAKLLWREEIIDVLVEHKIKFRKKDRNWLLCELLSEQIDIITLSEIVRKKLKSRTDWKLDTTEYQQSA
jgi:hypothetical protein